METTHVAAILCLAENFRNENKYSVLTFYQTVRTIYNDRLWFGVAICSQYPDCADPVRGGAGHAWMGTTASDRPHFAQAF